MNNVITRPPHLTAEGSYQPAAGPTETWGTSAAGSTSPQGAATDFAKTLMDIAGQIQTPAQLEAFMKLLSQFGISIEQFTNSQGQSNQSSGTGAVNFTSSQPSDSAGWTLSKPTVVAGDGRAFTAAKPAETETQPPQFGMVRGEVTDGENSRFIAGTPGSSEGTEHDGYMVAHTAAVGEGDTKQMVAMPIEQDGQDGPVSAHTSAAVGEGDDKPQIGPRTEEQYTPRYTSAAVGEGDDKPQIGMGIRQPDVDEDEPIGQATEEDTSVGTAGIQDDENYVQWKSDTEESTTDADRTSGTGDYQADWKRPEIRVETERDSSGRGTGSEEDTSVGTAGIQDDENYVEWTS